MSDKKKKKLHVGKDSVVMGNVSGNVGDRSVVIGPTANRGNTIINQPMAVGFNAHAGPCSIAIGAHAGAGSNIAVVFNEIGKIIQTTNDPELMRSFVELCKEIERPKRKKSLISKLWDKIKTASVLGGAMSLVDQATDFIESIIKKA